MSEREETGFIHFGQGWMEDESSPTSRSQRQVTIREESLRARTADAIYLRLLLRFGIPSAISHAGNFLLFHPVQMGEFMQNGNADFPAQSFAANLSPFILRSGNDPPPKNGNAVRQLHVCSIMDRFTIRHAAEVTAEFLWDCDVQFLHELFGRLVFNMKRHFLQNMQNTLRKPLQNPLDLPVKIVPMILVHKLPQEFYRKIAIPQAFCALPVWRNSLRTSFLEPSEFPCHR